MIGWFRFPDEWWDHLKRLQRGLYQRMLIEYVWGRMVPREAGGTMPEWSEGFSYPELAERCGCSAEQMRDDARDAKARGLLAVKETRGRVQFQILWERWPNIKDYVAPRPQLVEKKAQAKIRSHWFTRRVTVAPGECYDFNVPSLPEDFQLQKISFRNTGQSESVIIAGGGSADGGVIVLETEAENGKAGNVRNKADTGNERECNTQTAEKKVPQLRGGGAKTGSENRISDNENSVSGAGSSRAKRQLHTGNDGVPSSNLSFTSPLAKTLAGYGILSDLSVNKLIADCQAWAAECTLDEIEQAVRVTGEIAAADPKSRNVAGIILTRVPDSFKSGKYKAPMVGRKAAGMSACPFCQCDRVNSMGICAACGQSREVATRRAEQRKKA